MKSELTELLKQLRIEKNIKQEDVAVFIGVGKGTISNYEMGKTEPDIETFMRMCSFYGVDGTELLKKAYNSQPVASVSEREKELIHNYRAMNEEGQEKVVGYISDLVETGRYKKLDKFCMGNEEKAKQA